MEHQTDKQQKYTCPMHPEVIQDKPGNCPKCGMTLVSVNEKAEEHAQHQHSEQKKENHSLHTEHVAPVVEMRATQGFQKYTCGERAYASSKRKA